jgi:LuxR family transcriptional regulator, transcriptional regulator of spore coat protein
VLKIENRNPNMLNLNQIDSQPHLSGREQQILELVAVGLSAKEVALEIDIAPRTVERHIENIRLKLRARNRTHMVTCAAMAGMLTAGPAVHAEPTVQTPAYAASDTRQAYIQTGSVNGQRSADGHRSANGHIHQIHGSAVVSGYMPLRLVG